LLDVGSRSFGPPGATRRAKRRSKAESDGAERDMSQTREAGSGAAARDEGGKLGAGQGGNGEV
jgi:hypothetical protein